MKANKGSFPIQLKKILPFFCCFLLSILVINVAQAQNSHGYVPMNSKGTTYKRLASDSTFGFPTGCGAPSGTASLNNGTDELASLYFDSCGKTMYVFDPSDSTWSASSSAATNGECYRYVQIDSSNFNDATTFTDATLSGTILVDIILDDAPAFLYEGIDYTVVDSGATITLADFDATAEQYHFTVIAVDTTGACSNAVTVVTGGGSEDIGGGSTDKAFDELSVVSDTIVWDYSTGYNKTHTITDYRNIVITNDEDGDYGTLIIIQDGTGGRKLEVPHTDFLQDGINVVGEPYTIDLPDAPGSHAIVTWVNHSGTRYWTFGYYHQ